MLNNNLNANGIDDTSNGRIDNYEVINEFLNERKTSAGNKRTTSASSASGKDDNEEEKYWNRIIKPHINEMVNYHKSNLKYTQFVSLFIFIL